MKPRAVTERQREVLRFIVEHGVPPTLREIMIHFGWTSTMAATSHVRALETKGLIERVPGATRSIRVTPAGFAQMVPLEGMDPHLVEVVTMVHAALQPLDAEGRRRVMTAAAILIQR